jgi:hypothetical protein
MLGFGQIALGTQQARALSICWLGRSRWFRDQSLASFGSLSDTEDAQIVA